MKMQGLALIVVSLLASGCATTSTAPDAHQWIVPVQAVQLAADAAPGGVRGVFTLQVRGTGTQNGFVYLNSEADYRDQRNLTIALAPAVTRQLAGQLGGDPMVVLKDKHILVNGAAVRTRIDFLADGKVTDKYYYQTHVRVADPRQITVQQEN